jgi:hypothetical protein
MATYNVTFNTDATIEVVVDFKTGIQGATGEDGTDGSTWINGNGTPGAGVGVDGDYFLDLNTYDLYNKVSGSWVLIGNIKGPQGPPGDGGGGSIPVGGSTGQHLAKDSAVDFDAVWVDPPTGDKHYEHDQSVAAATWNITHSLGNYPSVVIVDTTGDVMYGEINYVDNNNITITFSEAVDGKAYLN